MGGPRRCSRSQPPSRTPGAARGPERKFYDRSPKTQAVRQPAEVSKLPYAVGACVSTEGISRSRRELLCSRMPIQHGRSSCHLELWSVTDGGAELQVAVPRRCQRRRGPRIRDADCGFMIIFDPSPTQHSTRLLKRGHVRLNLCVFLYAARPTSHTTQKREFNRHALSSDLVALRPPVTIYHWAEAPHGRLAAILLKMYDECTRLPVNV